MALSSKNRITVGIFDDGVCMYIMPSGNKSGISRQFFEIKKSTYNNEFFDTLRQILTTFVNENRQSVQNAEVVLVLSDKLVSTDTIELPLVRGLKPQSMLLATEKGLFKNQKELKINRMQLSSSKQSATYALTILRSDLYANFQEVFSAVKLPISTVTFAASASVNSVLAINSKLKSANFLLLDIKEGSSVFVFVNKGRAVGFYTLPFGSETLSPLKLSQENALFNHSTAEIAVINAEERAKAKKLTMESTPDDDAEDGETNNEFETSGVGINVTQINTLSRAAKKSQKYIQRPVPETGGDYIFENFRIFEKWALNLIRSNTSIVSAGEPEAVYVNLSGDFPGLFERVNEESQENGITFTRLDTNGESKMVTDNLELYGGFFASQYNKNNNF